MASTATLTGKYIVTILASTGFWIIPVSVKAPRLMVFGSFLASLTGYTACFCMAGSVEDEQEFNQLERAQKKELVVHRYSLEEIVMKQLMDAEFFGPPVEEEPEAEAIAVAVQQQLRGQPQPKQLPQRATLPKALEFIVALAHQSNGRVTVREVNRHLRELSADEIKQLFQQLAERQIGTIRTDKRSTIFELSQ
jgi:hypothetical protein